MLESDDGLFFRIPRWNGSPRSVRREVRILTFLGRHLSVPIPQPLYVGRLRTPRGWPFWVYRKLPGVPLSDLETLSRPERVRLTRFLMTMFSDLSNLHVPSHERPDIRSGDQRAWANRFRKLRRRYAKVTEGHLPPSLHRAIAEQFQELDATLAASRYRPVVLHGDLWPNHILWDARTSEATGVIDWEDTRRGDPAFDLRALGALGPKLLQELIESRRSRYDRLFERRLAFYRRLLPLHGLLFGIEAGRVSIERSHVRELRESLQLPVP
jgi:aminoglycoside 2''-phosphotransferase